MESGNIYIMLMYGSVFLLSVLVVAKGNQKANNHVCLGGPQQKIKELGSSLLLSLKGSPQFLSGQTSPTCFVCQ